MKKRLLIGGCSFSQHQEVNNSKWISWTNLLNEELKNKFEIINKAQSSFGQNRIVDSVMEELIKHNFEIDYVIVQWSAVYRDMAHNMIDKSYESSFNKIFMMKTLLNSKSIPHKMFWGWQQLTPKIVKENSKIIDLIHDDNFWIFNQYGGMSEYIIDKLGKDVALIGNGDFHPSTVGQEFFYRNVVKSWKLFEMV